MLEPLILLSPPPPASCPPCSDRRVQEVFHTPDHYYMVMDLYTGGDMYARYRFRSEADTAKIVGKLINALRYCHDKNIAVSFEAR